MTYQSWMAEVNDRCLISFGMSIYDLPDMAFHDAFDSGQTPEQFIDEQIPDLHALGELVLG